MSGITQIHAGSNIMSGITQIQLHTRGEPLHGGLDVAVGLLNRPIHFLTWGV